MLKISNQNSMKMILWLFALCSVAVCHHFEQIKLDKFENNCVFNIPKYRDLIYQFYEKTLHISINTILNKENDSTLNIYQEKLLKYLQLCKSVKLRIR